MEAHSAYTDLLLRHRTRVWRLCWHYANGDWERCRDLVQEVSLELWEHFGSLRTNARPHEERAWVTLHTRRTLNHLHRKSKHVYVSLTPDNSDALTCDNDSSCELVDDLLDTLSSADRQLVELRMKGYDATEIAEQMGITRDAVYQRLHRIVVKLRDKYGYEK